MKLRPLLILVLLAMTACAAPIKPDDSGLGGTGAPAVMLDANLN